MCLLKKRRKAFPLFFLVISLFLACSPQEKKKTITFADAGWDSIKFHNAVAGFIAENIFNYQWTESPGSTALMHEGLIKGEIDIHMECWAENIASYYTDRDTEKFHELGINFNDNYQGFYMPRYVQEGDSSRNIDAIAPELKHVKDIKNYPELFPDDEQRGKGRVYGSIPGWEADIIMYNKFLHYGLDANFVYFRPGSDAALSAAISSAYERGLPIIAYYWEPTWLLGLYDMVLLEDEPYSKEKLITGACALPAVHVAIAASNQFYNNEENKDFNLFLSRYKTSSALTSEGLAYMQETDADYSEAALHFLRSHPELLGNWLTADQLELLNNILFK